MMSTSSVSKDYSAIHIESPSSDSEEGLSPGQMLNQMGSISNESEDLLPQGNQSPANRGLFSRFFSGIGTLCYCNSTRISDTESPQSGPGFSLSGRNMLLLAGGTLVTAAALVCYVRHAQAADQPQDDFADIPKPEALRLGRSELLTSLAESIIERKQNRYSFGLG